MITNRTTPKAAHTKSAYSTATNGHESAAKSHKIAAKLCQIGDLAAATENVEGARGHSAKAHELATKAQTASETNQSSRNGSVQGGLQRVGRRHSVHDQGAAAAGQVEFIDQEAVHRRG